jgi:hypothetical protein
LGDLDAPILAVKGRDKVSDVLTPLAGGHVFAGTWEGLAALDTATCEACGEHVKIGGKLLWLREEGAAGCADEGLCAGWSTPRADALDRLVRGMTRETPNDDPNGPTEAALVAVHEAHVHVLKIVLPLVSVVPSRRALRQEGDRIADLTAALSDDARALRLAHEASDPVWHAAVNAPVGDTADLPADAVEAFRRYTPKLGERRLSTAEFQESTGLPVERVTAEELAERWARQRYEAMHGLYPTWEAMPPHGRAMHTAAMLPIAAEVTALRQERDAIGRAIDEAGIGVNGPDDTLVARVDRLIADANEEGDKLEALREKARAVCEADAALIERIDLDTCDAVNDAIDALRAEVDKP